jgi:hypothetical protein
MRMGEKTAETYYRIIPECPVCSKELKQQAKPIDMCTGRNEQIHHIIDCHGCETRLELVINHEYPLVVEIWVTPVDKELT